MIELSRYALEALRKDEEFILYRGRSQGDLAHILVLSPIAEYPTPESLKRLEHEYSLREELDPAWSARPIAMARHLGRMVLELEDPGGIPLDQLLGYPLDLEPSLRLALMLKGTPPMPSVLPPNSKRKQNVPEVLKVFPGDCFLISTTRNATANPRYGFGPGCGSWVRDRTVFSLT